MCNIVVLQSSLLIIKKFVLAKLIIFAAVTALFGVIFLFPANLPKAVAVELVGQSLVLENFETYANGVFPDKWAWRRAMPARSTRSKRKAATVSSAHAPRNKGFKSALNTASNRNNSSIYHGAGAPGNFPRAPTNGSRTSTTRWRKFT